MVDRIVSLLPSSTEIACALGLKTSLVGVSHECDYPADIVGLPVLTEPKLNPKGTSREIDDRVHEIVQDGLSVYRLHTDKLQQLKPDLVLTQDHCEVCAVSLSEVKNAVRSFVEGDLNLVSLHPTNLGDIKMDIRKVAVATGREQHAENLIDSFEVRFEKLKDRTKNLPKYRIACLEWLDPLMAAGNWVPELVEIAGGQQSFVDPGKHSSWLDWESLVEYQPEVIVLMPCGFKIPQSQIDLPVLTNHPLWQEIPAVQDNRVYIADGNAYFNRPGPRIVESAEILAEILHPVECSGIAAPNSYISVANNSV